MKLYKKRGIYILFLAINLMVLANSLVISALADENKDLYGESEGYAIIVGISDYPGSDYDLAYASYDAEEIYNELIYTYGFDESNIEYLTDLDASENGIVGAFNRISQEIDKNDKFVFYYSGHGDIGVNSPTTHTTSIQSINYPSDYPDSYDGYNTIHHADAIYIRVHFSVFQLESGWDYVYLGDSSLLYDYYFQEITGSHNDYWSDWIPVSLDGTLYIRMITDYIYSDTGYLIDSYEVESANGSHYLCSYDSMSDPSKYFSDDELDTYLELVDCDEQFIIIDSCYSGGMIPELEQSGRFIITACEDEELSLEDPYNYQGCFTQYFLDADDYSNQQYISMEEIYDYAYENTVSRSTDLGLTHHPQVYDGIEGDSYLYIDMKTGPSTGIIIALIISVGAIASFVIVKKKNAKKGEESATTSDYTYGTNSYGNSYLSSQFSQGTYSFGGNSSYQNTAKNPSAQDYSPPLLPNGTIWQDSSPYYQGNTRGIISNQNYPNVNPPHLNQRPKPLPIAQPEEKYSIKITCPICEQLVTKGNKFCTHCGTRL